MMMQPDNAADFPIDARKEQEDALLREIEEEKAYEVFQAECRTAYYLADLQRAKNSLTAEDVR